MRKNILTIMKIVILSIINNIRLGHCYKCEILMPMRCKFDEYINYSQ